MALETLKGVTEIGGFRVAHMDEVKKQFPEMVAEDGVTLNWRFFEENIRPKYPIQIRHDKNSVAFTIQKGPVKENGVNGCQVDTLIHIAERIISGLNKKFPCKENANAIRFLGFALNALAERTNRRTQTGIEGTDTEEIGV